MNIIGVLFVMFIGFIFAQISGKVARIIVFSIMGILATTLLIYAIFFLKYDVEFLKLIFIICVSYVSVLKFSIKMHPAIYILLSFGIPILGFLLGCVYKEHKKTLGD